MSRKCSPIVNINGVPYRQGERECERARRMREAGKESGTVFLPRALSQGRRGIVAQGEMSSGLCSVVGPRRVRYQCDSLDYPVDFEEGGRMGLLFNSSIHSGRGESNLLLAAIG